MSSPHDHRPYETLVDQTALTLDGLPAPDSRALASLLDLVPARAVVVGLDHRYLFGNREFCTFMGIEPRRLVGMHVRDLVGEDAYNAYLPIVARLLAGETLSWEAWVDYPDQGRRYVQERLVPWRPDGGEVRAFIAFGRDLTELKRQAESLADQVTRLERSETMKAAIVDNALAAIVTTTDTGHIVGFNPAAEHIFGLPAAEAIGRLVADVMIPERDRPAHEAGMRRLASGGQARSLGKRLELTARRTSGEEFPIEMVLWRTDVAGQAHYTASIVDLSERRRNEALIEHQREALRQAEKLGAMGSLLAGVAHELNNPLAIVMGRAALLEEKLADQPALLRDTRSVREAAERCGRIVRTFLNMARQRPLTRTRVQLNDLVQAACDILAYGLRSHGVHLSLQLDPHQPDIDADGDQLGQVVMNLLVNAQQALASLPASARSIQVSTGHSLTPGAQQVWLRVADSGEGIPAALRERVFEPFFTTKSEGSGTGLGLAVSRGIAKEHGGELVLEDTATGASFVLSLPLGHSDAVTAGTTPDAPPDTRTARVLVIDDEPEIAELVTLMLDSAGHEACIAEDGTVALAMVEEAQFDAVISDLHMPGMDGPELWRHLLARQPALARRTLFVTGDTLSPAVSAFLNASGCSALSKPFGKTDLLAAVDALLRR